jgi:hypothetical protein
MKAKIFVGLIALVVSVNVNAGLFGPGKFEISQPDNRFSENKSEVWTSSNNRISKRSIAGGVHVDASGVFINPMVVKDPGTGKVIGLALNLVNVTSYDTAFGSPNTLGAMQEIAFLINETTPIVLPVEKGDSTWSDGVSYNTVTKSASSDILETGIARLTVEQYQQIIAAESIAVKITGSKRSVTYEAKHIAKTFIPNLQSFYEQKVKE